MLADFITTGPVRLVGSGLLAAGLLALARAHRSTRFTTVLTGLGALLGTLGVVTGYKGFLSHSSDGPTGWTSLRGIYLSVFDSWTYVLIFGVCAAVLWVGVARLMSHRWSLSSTFEAAVGSIMAAVMLGLLDESI